jgi:hypothetical protein
MIPWLDLVAIAPSGLIGGYCGWLAVAYMRTEKGSLWWRLKVGLGMFLVFAVPFLYMFFADLWDILCKK